MMLSASSSSSCSQSRMCSSRCFVRLGVQVQLRQHLLVPLKDLDGVPAQVCGRPPCPAMDSSMWAMACSTLPVNTWGSSPACAWPWASSQTACSAAAMPPSPFRALISTTVAAQGLAQLFQVDLVPVFAHQVDHVHRHHHGDAQLDELGGEVQVALDVGAVHDVQDGVGLLVHQIAPGHHLLQRVGGEGIDAGQVLDDHVLVALQPALLLFHGDAGPVAHVLVGAGQVVEQRGLAAVRVACQRDFDVPCCLLPL